MKNQKNTRIFYIWDIHMIIRKYNYRLETGIVGTDDGNIAGILYNINRMEINSDFETDDNEELEESLEKLFFMIVDSIVHFNNFLETFRGKTNAKTVAVITATLDETIEDVRGVRDMADKENCFSVFTRVYRKLLEIVPLILTLDAQAAGRAA